MVEAQSMVEFMLDDAVVNTTSLLEGDHLFASCPPKAGEAPEKDGRNNGSHVIWIVCWKSVQTTIYG